MVRPIWAGCMASARSKSSRMSRYSTPIGKKRRLRSTWRSAWPISGTWTPSGSPAKAYRHRTSYYGLWVVTLENMMLKYGIATNEELKAGHALAPMKKADEPVTAAKVANMVRCGSPYDRSAPAPPKFKVGDKVRARNVHPKTHTRLPRYARGHTGEVVRVVGCHVFPDSNAIGIGEDAHWLYTVRFDGRELWGQDSDPTVRVAIEAWEPYLESA
jgi:nitrile hydratase subunit beta